MTKSTSQPSGHYRNLPKGIWALGFVSMFMDISSELIHSLLPIYMTTVLGVSMITVGFIEGIAEATAAITKVFSGTLSDYLGKRKWLAVLGYALGAFTKPVFPLANSVGWIFAARFVDRIGKGIRGAPRDALVADIAPPQLRGAAFGLRQSLDSAGAFIGPALAVLAMLWLANDIKTVLWIGVIPAFIAVGLLVVGVEEPDSGSTSGTSRKTLSFADAKNLHGNFWAVVMLGAVFTLARFSEAFLILRAQDAGLGMAWVPLTLIVMNMVYAGLAYPAGIAADRVPARTLLIYGLLVLVAADLILAVAGSPLVTFAGAALWGLHMALTQGLLAKLVADTAPAQLRGTAFGIFNLASGIALLLASVIAGGLWSAYGASATFMAGAGFAGVAATGLLLYKNRHV
jgi:MFS family permease